ncbi:hypothetical protein GGF32_007236, partial [Allomyces javanicus]
ATVGLITCLAVFWVLPETRTNVAKLPVLSFLQDKRSLQDSLIAAPAMIVKDNEATMTLAATAPNKSLTFTQLLRDRPIVLTTLMYGCTAGIEIGFMEICVLWSKLPLDQGGVAYDSSDIGIMTLTNGVVILVIQLLFFEAIERRVGPLNLYRIGTLIPIASHLMASHMPELWQGASPGNYLLFGIVLQSIASLGTTFADTTVFILMSNAALDKDKGACGSMFAASLNNKHGPFNYHITFYLLALLSLVTFAATLMLSSKINQPRESEEQHVAESANR